jgi:hypothetical protein
MFSKGSMDDMPNPSRSLKKTSDPPRQLTHREDIPHPATAGPPRAIEHVRRMRGGSQPHTLRCSDGHYYVAKVPNNPQGVRILVNELLGSRLAALLRLPVAIGRVILVEQELIRYSPEMVIQNNLGETPCQAGMWFGSCYPVDPRFGEVDDLLPLSETTNHVDFLGMLVFDKWAGNTDGRQVVFSRNRECRHFTAVMIDQGFCFNATEWNFPDSPLRGRYCRTGTYDGVKGMDSFEPWLSRLESEIDENALLSAAHGIPPEWYEGQADSLCDLLEKLDHRRRIVRELLWATHNSYHQIFPNWTSFSKQ